MDVKFENGEVPIWKVRQGSVVRMNGIFYHIDAIYPLYGQPGLDDIRLSLKGGLLKNNDLANPRHVEWLEPM